MTTTMKWARLCSSAALLAGDQLQEQGGDAERREAHDPADDHQAKFLQFLNQNADVAVALAADDQRDAEKEGDDHDGQDVALGQRLERVLEQAAQELGDVVGQRHLACLEIPGGLGEHLQLQAFAGPENVRGAEADHDRQGHGGEEEGERRRPHPMHLVVGAQVGDADDDGREDQRHQHHAQQVEEQVADHFGAVERVLRQRASALAPASQKPPAMPSRQPIRICVLSDSLLNMRVIRYASKSADCIRPSANWSGCGQIIKAE